MAKDHFVPQHYLRQFGVDAKLIAAAAVSPYKFFGVVPIDGQCQGKNFYEKNKPLDDLLWATENDIAPVLVDVTANGAFDAKKINALKMLAVMLNLRTRKAVETAKLFPKYHAKLVIENAIRQGELPPLPDGDSLDEVIDFKGVAGPLIQEAIPCWMETQTLSGKLLKAEAGTMFLASDHPSVVLNHFCAGLDPNQSFAGFSRSGFQLVLPLSPQFCLFLYDPKVYKVGFRRERVVNICRTDMDIVNSLQVQSADNCVYFSDPNMEHEVRKLVERYQRLRVPIQSRLKVLPGRDENEEFISISGDSAKLPAVWQFCRYLRHTPARVGGRRDEAWTALAEKLNDDIVQNPTGGNIFTRLEKLLS
jgi:hypothetical protein